MADMMYDMVWAFIACLILTRMVNQFNHYCHNIQVLIVRSWLDNLVSAFPFRIEHLQRV